MTPEQVQAVQDSFKNVIPISDRAAALFYSRLFEIAPDVKLLFHDNMIEQGRKLMATLAFIVHGLHNLQTVLPAASELAKHHVDYGVKAAHYTPFGTALLWMLEKGLGNHWTPDLAAAWREAYTMLSDFMIAQAYGRPQGAA